MRSLLTRVLPLAVAVAFAVALGGPPAEAQSPFAGGARIAVNEAGQAVVAWRSVGGVRAVVGDKIASRLVEIQASSRITLSASAVGPLSYGGQSDEATVRS